MVHWGCYSVACARNSYAVRSVYESKADVSAWMLGRAAQAAADREVVAHEVPDAALLGASLGGPSIELDSEAAWVSYPFRAAVM